MVRANVFVSCLNTLKKHVGYIKRFAENSSDSNLHKMPPKRKFSSSDSKASSPKKQKSLDGFVQKLPAVITEPKAVATMEKLASSSWLADLVIENGWKRKLLVEFNKKYFKDIENFLSGEYSNGKEIFPPKHLIFNAFNLTPLHKIKIVILGQDPYHDNGQAHGLSFSVPIGKQPPPSLNNIYKELSTDIDGFKIPDHGCLEKWAKEGVLLLNATLTVQAHKANSHATVGWQTFTDAAIKVINDECNGVVFILWGGFAQKKDKLINKKKHFVINAAHPSPLSVTKFRGCKCFSKANDALKEKYNKTVVDWILD